MESEGGCFLPGWDEGPAFTGGEPDEYYCELPNDHEGDHAWNVEDDDEIVTWPVGWVQYYEIDPLFEEDPEDF